jgi:succinyl-CoA synthetase beta subunit
MTIDERSSCLVALERRFGGPVIISSTQGGGNIEEIAAEHPDAIIRHPIDITTGLLRSDALQVAGQLGFQNQALEEVNHTCYNIDHHSHYHQYLFFLFVDSRYHG